MNLNQVNLIGRVTADPEVKALERSGTTVASFSLATNRTWKNDKGEKQEEVQFHNIVAFGKTAEIVEDYVSKGMLLFVNGRLQTRSWEDKDSGKKQYRTEIIVDTLQLPPKSMGTGGGESQERTTRPAKKSEVDKQFEAIGSENATPPEDAPTTGGKRKARPVVEGEENINIDDIPF